MSTVEERVTPVIMSIEEAIPHRPPFLFLDEIVDVTETTVLARRTVRADEPQFEGHYPERPIMPGVLLCEAIMQAGCYLLMHRMHSSAAEEMAQGVPVVARMNDIRFKQMVKPGDELEIFCEFDKTAMGVHFMKGKIKKGAKIAASLSFLVTLAKDV